MPVDQFYSLVADLVSASSSYLLAIVAIATVAIAGVELGKWRRELLGRASHEAASKLYASVKRWQYAYHGARNPVSYIDDDEEAAPHEGDDQRLRRLSRDHRFGLLEALRQKNLAVEEANWEVETSSEESPSDLVNALIRHYRDLRSDFYSYFDLQEYVSSAPSDVKERNELRRKVYGLDSDARGQAVQSDVDALLSKAKLISLGKTR